MRALISVSDKTGVVEFAKGLRTLGWEVIATGGTMKLLADSGVEVINISDVTGFPEICDGRVKTLHPNVHGGLLAKRDNEAHMAQAAEHGIEMIDMVVVNLYAFEKTVAGGADFGTCIENIDIGGPSMLRSAAKNFESVAVVTRPASYDAILAEMRANDGATLRDTRAKLALDVFETTAAYDGAIAAWMGAQLKDEGDVKFPADRTLHLSKVQDLRYGENPHQKGHFYGNLEAMFDQIHGKEISYNNLLDINAAVDLIDEFEETTFAVLKHNNACGLASRPTVLEAWNDALAGDPVSAFGGVLITNGVIDKDAAEEINKIFFEVIIAPDYDVDALEILGQKKNRIILVRKPAALPKKQFRSLLNGVLVQDRDLNIEKPEDLKTATTKAPTAQEIEDMLFANKIVKNSKSNAIVLAKGKQLLASGVGQTSRVDALKQAIEKAKNFGFDLKGAVMASDAFFPFPDCVEIAGNEGVTAVIQPGGSIKDQLSFDYCNEHGIAMVTTGIRHFKH